MTVVQDIGSGVLTGSGTQDTIRQAGGAVAGEMVDVVFRNKDSTSRTLTIYRGGNTADYVVYEVDLAPDEEVVVIEAGLGPSDILYAEASAGSAIIWNMHYIQRS